MKSIHDLENELFDEWIEYSRQLDVKGVCPDIAPFYIENKFAPDGLLYHNGPYYNGGYWEMGKGREEEDWYNSPQRLLIVTKDLNNQEIGGEIANGWDIRCETGFKNENETKNYWSAIPFYKRLRMWAYGLLNMDVLGSYPTFDEAYDMDKSGPFYNMAPIARINVKKKCGKGFISDYELSKNIELYKDLLVRNFRIYDKADIILCCDPHRNIKDFIQQNLIPDLKCIYTSEYYNNLQLYYSSSTNKVVINGYHPSSRTSYEDMYYELMFIYQSFIKSRNSNK